MKKYFNPLPEEWEKLCARASNQDAEKQKVCIDIITNIKERGDDALRGYNLKFDNYSQELYLPVDQDFALLAPDFIQAVQMALGNIKKFHQIDLSNEVTETAPGIKCWRKYLPIERVGFYVPGGNALLFSSLIMLLVPAKIAGCKEIIICTPPFKNQEQYKKISYICSLFGITGIYQAGGAQAIAAMAYGTETIPKVHKIFGPGNYFVNYAKQYIQMYSNTSIDMPAGPSEELIIADYSARVSDVVSELLAQAEHGVDSQVVLLTSSKSLLDKLDKEIEVQLAEVSRQDLIRKSLANSFCIYFDNTEAIIAFSNLYAPEHLQINCADSDVIAEKITAAGSVFMGKYSPVAAGDYCSGTNHVLPTAGFARSLSGLNIHSFLKTTTFQELSRSGLEYIADSIVTLAKEEGLDAHANAVIGKLK